MSQALVVVAHPDPTSLTHHAARQVSAALAAENIPTAIADLHREGFDPRFGPADRDLYSSRTGTPPDVLAEQERLDGVDHLVLVFPVYWWSMPALLKGWIDRVFVNGWAFDDTVTPMDRRLGRMTIHLVMMAADDADSFARRGYDTALSTQIVTGIVGYVGARVGVTAIVHGSENRSNEGLDGELASIAESVVESARRRVDA